MRRWRTWVLVALVVWIVVVAWWFTKPLTDTVPTGIVKDIQTAQAVKCDSPLSGNTTPTESLPELPANRAYERAACETAITNDRVVFAIDVAVVLAALVILAKTWKPGEVSLEDVSVA